MQLIEWGEGVSRVISHKMAENNSIIGERIASLLQSWSTPAYQNFDWGVALFAAGIAAYFAFPFEPSLMILAGLCFVLLTGLWLSDRFTRRLYPFILILALLALGLGRAAWHTQAVSEPILPKYERSYTVTGWIEACLLYTSPSPRDQRGSRMPSSA